jgi:hypothetical protein
MPRDALRRGAKILTLVLSLMLLWSLAHHYLGLGGDARLYAVQALAKANPNLFNDLYLKNVSQDSYTLFSSLYAPCIGLMGLGTAAFTLTLAFKILFFTASWVLARSLFQGACAFSAVALLILIPGAYGAFGVFQYAEDWMTARSAAEALVVTAIACSLCGHRLWALLIACGAMLLHPLMALPGLLWLLCLWLPLRLSALAAASGTLLVLAIASIASWTPLMAHLVVVMDADWLEVVRERSQFLLLQTWRASDWSQNARPLLSLSLSVLVIEDARVRKVGTTAILVGAAGLMLALIASLVGPVAILLQGQAWRWVWVTSFASVLLLVPTLRALWRPDRYGLLCVPLVICGWMFSTIAGTICLACALILWLARDLIKDRVAKYQRDMGTRLESLSHAAVATFWSRGKRRPIVLSLTIGTLVAACLYSLPRALHDGTTIGSVAEIDAYSDWRRAIPADANVLVAPVRNSAAFAWFTLQRPSYLTVDQSSGVVFSRSTALEVRRRSQVLLPLMDPDWRLLSNMRQARSSGGKSGTSVRSLTRERLMGICRDPQLNFVVAAENIGFTPLRHARPGGQRDWYLYDCRIVNDASPSP